MASSSTSDEAAAVRSPGPVVAAPGAAEDDHDEAAAVSPAPAAAAAAARPYYECVFCRRGFTTAQALGGHMNIHRRDRGSKPAAGRDTAVLASVSSSSSRNQLDSYNQYRHLAPPPYHQLPPPRATTSMTTTSSSFAMFYRGGTGAMIGLVDDDDQAVSPSSSGRPKELTLFGAAAGRDHDDSQQLGLGCLDRGGGEGSSERQQAAGEPPERELDLELRLGRRPRR